MNYLAWRPTDSTHITHTPSTHILVLGHIQDQGQGQGIPGQAMRLIHWQTQQACLPLEYQVRQEDPRTVTANNKPTLVTRATGEEMEVEMGAQRPHRQRNPTGETKCPKTQVSTFRVLECMGTTWELELIQLST